MVVIGLALSVVDSNRENERLTAEIQALCDRLAQAVEPNQLYWRRLPAGFFDWRYRVYLPAIQVNEFWQLLVVYPGGEKEFNFLAGICYVHVEPQSDGKGKWIVNLTMDHDDENVPRRFVIVLGADAITRLREAHRVRNVAHGPEFHGPPKETMELVKTDDVQLLIRKQKR